MESILNILVVVIALFVAYRIFFSKSGKKVSRGISMVADVGVDKFERLSVQIQSADEIEHKKALSRIKRKGNRIDLDLDIKEAKSEMELSSKRLVLAELLEKIESENKSETKTK